MKAYKVFNSDWTCRNFQYEVGKTYKHEGRIKICNSGFHACPELVDCFSYYDFNPNNKVAEVEVSGEILKENNKVVCSEISILKELTWFEVLEKVNIGKNNTGFKNSGNNNSGDYNSGNNNSGNNNSGNNNSGNENSGFNNSGDYNSGDYNSGNNNSGNNNSGDYNSGFKNSGNNNSGNNNSGFNNSGDYNSGYRNSGNWNSCNGFEQHLCSVNSDKIRIFNKECSLEEWQKAEIPNFFYFCVTEWVPESQMNDEEKKNHKDYKVLGGYLKTLEYKEAWKKSWKNASLKDRKLVEKLPNFSWDIFTDITGIEKP